MRKKTNLDMRQIFCIIIVTSLVIGVMIGSVTANILNESQYLILHEYIIDYASVVRVQAENSSELFLNSFVKYSMIAVFIWILAWGKIGMYIALTMLLIRGVGFGFTTSFLVSAFALRGMLAATTLYLFQNILLVPIYMWLMYNNMAFVSGDMRKSKKEWLEYVFVLMIGIAVVVLACMIEIFIIPHIILF